MANEGQEKTQLQQRFDELKSGCERLAELNVQYALYREAYAKLSSEECADVSVQLTAPDLGLAEPLPSTVSPVALRPHLVNAIQSTGEAIIATWAELKAVAESGDAICQATAKAYREQVEAAPTPPQE